MTAQVKPFANKQAHIFVYCPKCGRALIEPRLDPRADTFRDWTDEERQELVDCQFQSRPVLCPVDGTRIGTAAQGSNVHIHCRRCGQIHFGTVHKRIGCKPLRIEAETSVQPILKVESNVSYDLFISHAHEDKEDVAEPLAKAFLEQGLNVWYDKFTLKIGDGLRRSIDRGLANSRYGLVILSPHFFKKHWTQKELDGLAALETAENRKILPVWHNVGHKEVANFSPTLADVIGISTTEGLNSIIEQVMRVVRPDASDPHEAAKPPKGWPQEAVDILKGAASGDGGFFVGGDLEGYCIEAGDFVFREKGNTPREVARLKGIIRKLRDAGFISQSGEELHEMTEAGFNFLAGLDMKEG